MICFECTFRGGQCVRRVQIATDRELGNHRFIRSVRATALSLSIPSRKWPDALADWLRDHRGCFIDDHGRVFELDLSHLEYPEGQEKEEAPFARWYQDFCNTPCRPGTTPFVRREAKERVHIVATLLRAKYPVRASTWGKVAANDNRSPNQSRQ